MAKKPGPGKCVHCLRDVEERNFDHVFPKAWYPDSTPPDLEKWQIPSCLRCNTEYGKLEQDFLLKVGMCLDPFAPASASIVRKMARSLNPAFGRNPRDAQHRLGKARNILSQTRQGDQIPSHGFFPGLGDRWAMSDERVAVPIPKLSFKRVTEKIVRGVFYIEDKKFIEPPYKIDFYAVEDRDATLVERMLDQFGSEYAREPGIVVRRAIAHEDGVSAVFAITSWQQFKTYAVVSVDRQPSHG